MPTQHAYWLALEDLPLEAVQYACVEVLKSETFMPPPAIIRGFALDYLEQCRQLAREEARRAEERQLLEPQLQLEELRALQLGIWPEERDRLIKDPIPPYETEETP